jgi:hypothetical protein
MLTQSLKKNSSEVFFDVAIARDQISSYSDRYMGERVFVKDIPKIETYSDRLKKKIPKNQEFSALIDVGKKTYLLSFSENKSSGRELFLDNKEVIRDILKYFLESEIGGLETLLRDAIADRYKNSIRLSKGKRHYIYMTNIHAKVPVNFPDIEYYFVSSIPNFLKNNTIKKSKMMVEDVNPGLIFTASALNAEEKISMDLVGWEVGAKKETKQINIDFNKIDWSENSCVEYSRLPIGKMTPTSNRILSVYANSRLGEKTFYSNDYANVSYFLGQNSDGLYILHSGHQFGTHNIKFNKRLFEKAETTKSIHIRMDEAKESARFEAPEDRYWTGYRLFTSALVEDN